MSLSSGAVVILGGSGLVGSRLARAWGGQRDVQTPSHAKLDVLDAAALDAYLADVSPEVVVNCVAWADVDGAEAESGNRAGRVHALNVGLPERLASAARRHGSYLVHLSTDYVFDGRQADRPYREDDRTEPLGWYARTKIEGEAAVAAGAPDRSAVVRIEMPFTPDADAPKPDVSRVFRSRLLAGQPIVAVDDQNITPVLLDDLVLALGEIVRARYTGLIHVAATTPTTPFGYARAIASRLGCDPSGITPTSFADFARTRAATRPQHSWLDVSRFETAFGGAILRSFEEQLAAWSARATASA